MKTRFLNLSRSQKKAVAVATDLICIALTLGVAVALHFSTLDVRTMLRYWDLLLAAPVLSVPVFAYVGFYRTVIRYIDHKIVMTVVGGAAFCATVLGLIAALILNHTLAASVYFIFGANLIVYLLVSRFIAHGFFRTDRRNRKRMRVAIYGAGEAGVQLANALHSNVEYLPVAFIDDNPELHRTTICGIRVFGPSRLPALIEEHDLGALLLAMPSLTPAEQRCIIDKLTPLKVRIKVTPPIKNLVKGHSRVEDVREIQIEDLLSRDPVAPDESLLSVCVSGKSVAVSGAGGSIGSELCRQIIKLSPRRLVLIELSEYALYSIDQELRGLAETEDLDVELVPFIGSVLDQQKCRAIFDQFEIDTVYHAAAYKHVPLVEHNPIEGIRNNVFGTLHFARAAVEAKVKCFVLVSTDKAVRPTNVMGATKRVAELILQAYAQQHGRTTRFCMVRFGNVLGSSGSVVPQFRRQIAAGGPVTVTHPDITRYFMTIPEAAQLVIQAGSIGKGGDVFVLDMGQPVKIADLAVRMIHLSGQEVRSSAIPDGTIELRYVGLRPGEKLYEELLIGDNVTGTVHPLIMRAQEAEIAWPFLEVMLKHLKDACDRFDHVAIRAQLLKLVGEYAPSAGIDDHLWKRLPVQETELDEASA